jgi:hypothetical protein
MVGVTCNEQVNSTPRPSILKLAFNEVFAVNAHSFINDVVEVNYLVYVQPVLGVLKTRGRQIGQTVKGRESRDHNNANGNGFVVVVS